MSGWMVQSDRVNDARKVDVITALEQELLAAICETCSVTGVEQKGMTADEPLLGPESRLGLDSLDSLEIVVMVQKRYGVRIESEQTSRIVLQNLATLAQYIRTRTAAQTAVSRT